MPSTTFYKNLKAIKVVAKANMVFKKKLWSLNPQTTSLKLLRFRLMCQTRLELEASSRERGRCEVAVAELR
jgi:hypothetical protein